MGRKLEQMRTPKAEDEDSDEEEAEAAFGGSFQQYLWQVRILPGSPPQISIQTASPI